MKLEDNDNNDNRDWNEAERCVICGKVTQYSRGDHIDFRNWYVEGAGQCCEACCVKAYGCN